MKQILLLAIIGLSACNAYGQDTLNLTDIDTIKNRIYVCVYKSAIDSTIKDARKRALIELDKSKIEAWHEHMYWYWQGVANTLEELIYSADY